MTEYVSLDLDRLEQLTAAATPGPWRWDKEYEEGGGLTLTNDSGDEIVGAYSYHCCDMRIDVTIGDADAEFIAAACDAVPALITSLRSARSIAAALEQELDRLATDNAVLRAEIAAAELRAAHWYDQAQTASR